MVENTQPKKQLYQLLYQTPHRELGGHTIFSNLGRYHNFGKFDEVAVLVVFDKELAPDELGQLSPKNLAPVKETAAQLGLVLGGIKNIDDFPDLKQGLRKAIAEKIRNHPSGSSASVLKDTLAIYDYLTGVKTLKEAKQLSLAARTDARGPSNLYVAFLDPSAARDPKTNLPVSYFDSKSTRFTAALEPKPADVLTPAAVSTPRPSAPGSTRAVNAVERKSEQTSTSAPSNKAAPILAAGQNGIGDTRTRPRHSSEASTSRMAGPLGLPHDPKRAVELFLTSPRVDFDGQSLFKNKMALTEVIMGMPSKGPGHKSPQKFTRTYQRIEGAFKTGNQLMSGGIVYRKIVGASIERLATLVPTEKWQPALAAFFTGFRAAIAEQFYQSDVAAVGIPADDKAFMKGAANIVARLEPKAISDDQRGALKAQEDTPKTRPAKVPSLKIAKGAGPGSRALGVLPPTELAHFLFGPAHEDLDNHPLFQTQQQIAKLIHAAASKVGKSSLPALQVAISSGMRKEWQFAPGNALHAPVKIAISERLRDEPELAHKLISDFADLGSRLRSKPLRKNQRAANHNGHDAPLRGGPEAGNGARVRSATNPSTSTTSVTPRPSRRGTNGLKQILSGLQPDLSGDRQGELSAGGVSDIRRQFTEMKARVTTLERREAALVEALQRAERDLSAAREAIQQFQQQAEILSKVLGKTAKMISSTFKALEEPKRQNSAASGEPTIPASQGSTNHEVLNLG